MIGAAADETLLFLDAVSVQPSNPDCGFTGFDYSIRRAAYTTATPQHQRYSTINYPSHFNEQTRRGRLNLRRPDARLMETNKASSGPANQHPSSRTAIATSRGRGAAHCDIETWGSH